MLIFNNDEIEFFSVKDLCLISLKGFILTLVAMFLGYFTEEFVVPQKVLACIASNVLISDDRKMCCRECYFSRT